MERRLVDNLIRGQQRKLRAVLAMEYGTSYSPKRVWALKACQGRITDYMTNFAAFGHDTLEDSIILARHAQKNFHLDVNDVSL